MESKVEYHIPTKLSDLTEEQKQKVFNWIDKRIVRKKYICHTRTAYGLKHRLQHDTGVYVTSLIFKESMVSKGFKSKEISEKNWCFNISEKLK